MKLDKIILELKQVELGEKRLEDIITKLEQDYMEDKFINKPSDKKKLSAIKKVVGNTKIKVVPYYNSFTRQKGKTYITDSYQLYELNDEYLPLEYASAEETLTDEEKQLVNKYKLTIKNGKYPKVDNLIDLVRGQEELYTFDVDEILKIEKTMPKENGIKLYSVRVNDLAVSFDLLILKNAINILKLQGKATLKLYGETSPIIIENNDGERGLILPIRTN